MNRNREDVKRERIIRGLAKLDDNRKCLNCGSLAPQYVCINFSTFVCMACSGVHREFNHRVKSISIARFSPEEVAGLQAGGNKHALERYFKHWDPRQHPLPDSRNPDKLRDFIKAIYVDQRYSANKPPPFPNEEEYDSRRRANFLSSHSFEERRPSEQKETHQRTRSEDRPSHNDLADRYSPPVRSMREILGDDMPSLRIEPARASAAAEATNQASFGSTPAETATTGWATFDTAPAAPFSSATGGWEEYRQSPGNSYADTGTYFTPAPAFYPALVPAVHQHDVPATTTHRKSINPFDLPEDEISASPMNPNFAFQHPQVTSPGEFLPPANEQAWFPVSFSPTAEFSPADFEQTSRPGNPFG